MSASKVVYIPKGSISKIIAHLEAEGVDVGSFDARVLPFMGKVQQGWLSMASEQMRKGDLLFALTHAKAAQKSITLIPGETSYFFLTDLANAFHLDRQKLSYYYTQISPYKEGALAPETYFLPKGLSEKQAIEILVSKSLKEQKALSHALLGSFDDNTWKRILIIASVIQKEAATNEEMPLVSSVIYNRLKKRMPLQMDGTLNYGKYSHTKVTPKMIKTDKSRYNTYRYKGLPSEPVCNVSESAIMAAIKPAKTDYLYFVKGKDGKHNFSRYYSTHVKNIKMLQNETY